MDALDKARAFFGDSWRLRVDPDYMAYPASSLTHTTAAAGKSYMGTVLVCLVEPEQ